MTKMSHATGTKDNPLSGPLCGLLPGRPDGALSLSGALPGIPLFDVMSGRCPRKASRSLDSSFEAKSSTVDPAVLTVHIIRVAALQKRLCRRPAKSHVAGKANRLPLWLGIRRGID
ncbi:hypothetical protein X742_31145 [Mesorhizobium sp. LNHC232B00]|nr:hypothetical protein X742_31145 [Mesorhizobium sp. LNHC232B00]